MKDLKKILLALSADNARRSTASNTGAAAPATPLPVIVETDTDKRCLRYIVDLYGKKSVLEACDKLPGSRKPYISNIIKIMNITIPEAIKTPTDHKLSAQKRESAKQNIANARKMLED